MAFYIFAFATPLWVTTPLVLACVALTFVPLKWVHPMRVEKLRVLTLLASAAWGIAAVITVYDKFPAGPWSMAVLAAVAVYGVGLTLWFGRDR